MSELICMVGLPRSGKSTYIDENLSDYQIVCPDDIRLSLGVKFEEALEPFVWGIHDTMIRAYMIRGKNVVVDATNTTEKSLRSYYNIALHHLLYEFKVIFIRTEKYICMNRNVGEGSVPFGVIKRMDEQLNVLIKSDFWQQLKNNGEIKYEK